MSILYVKDIKDIDAPEKEVIDALRKEMPDLVIMMDEEADPDIFLTVRVRRSKADNLIQNILGMGYSCKKFDLA